MLASLAITFNVSKMIATTKRMNIVMVITAAKIFVLFDSVISKNKRRQRLKQTVTKTSYLMHKFNKSSQDLIKCMLFMKCISHSSIMVMENVVKDYGKP